MNKESESEIYIITDRRQLNKGKIEKFIPQGGGRGQVVLREMEGKYEVGDGVLDVSVELEPGMPLEHPHSGVLYGN